MPSKKMELVVVTPLADSCKDVWSEAHSSSGSGLSDLAVRFVPTVWGSRGTSRNQGFLAASGRWVYFVDQDVRFCAVEIAAQKFALALEGALAAPQAISAWSGPYISDESCSYWGRTYNWLSNAWLMNSALGARVLAGNLLLRKSDFDFNFESYSGPFDASLQEGGEEIAFCDFVLSRGGKIAIDPRLTVIHQADHSLALFWRRLHGHAKIKKQLATPMKKTRVTPRVFARLLMQPMMWPGLVLSLVATGVAHD